MTNIIPQLFELFLDYLSTLCSMIWERADWMHDYKLWIYRALFWDTASASA